MKSLRIEHRGSGGDRRHRRSPARLIGIALLAALALAVFPSGAGAAPIYPPMTGSAVKTADGFELKGTVYPYGYDTTWHFEYGTTTAYSQSAPIPDADAGTAFSVPVSQTITGLEPNTTYHYRLVSNSSFEGVGDGADSTFSTAEGTATGQTPAPGGGTTETTGGSGETATVTGNGPKTVAKELKSKGKSLLVTKSGRTLYSLSAEHGGKFVCTMSSGCLSIWHPLTVAAGVTPKGPVPLRTVMRPEGDLQVTFRGRPLYTFGGDKKSGQTKGEGLKDVGTWHAAVVPGHR
jgi:predicted lipoprotein with Yx(FWY)xxD motif